jgi:hypothetical protein
LASVAKGQKVQQNNSKRPAIKFYRPEKLVANFPQIYRKGAKAELLQ